MREVKRITVKDGERDIKVRITPMDAVKAERWLMKAIFAVGAGLFGAVESGKPEDIASALNSVDYDKVAPLWDSLIQCVQIENEGGAAIDVTADTLAGKVDYPTTVFIIKMAALQANFGFFGGGGWRSFLTSMRGVLTSLKSEA